MELVDLEFHSFVDPAGRPMPALYRDNGSRQWDIYQLEWVTQVQVDFNSLECSDFQLRSFDEREHVREPEVAVSVPLRAGRKGSPARRAR
jgi:hypothetical protein